MTDRLETGRRIVREMFGEDLLTVSATATKFQADVATLALEQVYGDIWSRPGLGMRERSLVTLGALISQQQPNELANHIRGGLGNGLTPAEIYEAILQTTPYVGFPRVATALEIARGVLDEYEAAP